MKEVQLNRIALALSHSEVAEVVQEFSRKFELTFKDITSFEYECYQKIGKALQNYGHDIRDLKSYSRRICGRVAKVHLDRRKLKYDQISLHSTKGKGVFEVEDLSVLANAEKAFEENDSLQEKIALLAQRDSRKLFVLNAWANGITDELHLSRLLAQSNGGSVEGHRSFVKRFKKVCQTKLAGIA